MESEEAVEAAGSADVEVDTKDGGEEAGELEVQEEAAVQEGVSAQGDAPGNPEGDRDKENAEAEKSSAATLIQNAIRCGLARAEFYKLYWLRLQWAAALKLQMAYRCHMARKELYKIYWPMVLDATKTLQAMVRARLAIEAFSAMSEAKEESDKEALVERLSREETEAQKRRYNMVGMMSDDEKERAVRKVYSGFKNQRKSPVDSPTPLPEMRQPRDEGESVSDMLPRPGSARRDWHQSSGSSSKQSSRPTSGAALRKLVEFEGDEPLGRQGSTLGDLPTLGRSRDSVGARPPALDADIIGHGSSLDLPSPMADIQMAQPKMQVDLPKESAIANATSPEMGVSQAPVEGSVAVKSPGRASERASDSGKKYDYKTKALGPPEPQVMDLLGKVSQKLFEVTGVPIDPPPEFPSNETTFFLGKVSETLVELAGKNEVAVEEAPPPGREVDLGEVGGILDTVGSTPTPATNADISQLLLVCDLLNYYESDTATESESESVRIQRRREKMRKSPVKKLDASAEETEEDGRLEGDGGGGGAETDPEVRELKNKIKELEREKEEAREREREQAEKLAMETKEREEQVERLAKEKEEEVLRLVKEKEEEVARLAKEKEETEAKHERERKEEVEMLAKEKEEEIARIAREKEETVAKHEKELEEVAKAAAEKERQVEMGAAEDRKREEQERREREEREKEEREKREKMGKREREEREEKAAAEKKAEEELIAAEEEKAKEIQEREVAARKEAEIASELLRVEQAKKLEAEAERKRIEAAMEEMKRQYDQKLREAEAALMAQVQKVEEEKRTEISRLKSVVSMGHQEAEDRLEAELKATRERLEEEKRAHEGEQTAEKERLEKELAEAKERLEEEKKAKKEEEAAGREKKALEKQRLEEELRGEKERLEREMEQERERLENERKKMEQDKALEIRRIEEANNEEIARLRREAERERDELEKREREEREKREEEERERFEKEKNAEIAKILVDQEEREKALSKEREREREELRGRERERERELKETLDGLRAKQRAMEEMLSKLYAEKQEKEVQLGRLKTPDGVRPPTSGTIEAVGREGGEGALTEEEVMDALNSDIVQRSEEIKTLEKDMKEEQWRIKDIEGAIHDIEEQKEAHDTVGGPAKSAAKSSARASPTAKSSARASSPVAKSSARASPVASRVGSAGSSAGGDVPGRASEKEGSKGSRSGSDGRKFAVATDAQPGTAHSNKPSSIAESKRRTQSPINGDHSGSGKNPSSGQQRLREKQQQQQQHPSSAARNAKQQHGHPLPTVMVGDTTDDEPAFTIELKPRPESHKLASRQNKRLSVTMHQQQKQQQQQQQQLAAESHQNPAASDYSDTEVDLSIEHEGESRVSQAPGGGGSGGASGKIRASSSIGIRGRDEKQRQEDKYTRRNTVSGAVQVKSEGGKHMGGGSRPRTEQSKRKGRGRGEEGELLPPLQQHRRSQSGRMTNQGQGGHQGVLLSAISSQKSPTAPLTDGHHRVEYKNGDIYEGSFKNGMRHGAGTYQFVDGDCYEGAWHNGRKHGHGTYTWKDGSKYVGSWSGNRQDGDGTYVWNAQAQYAGKWKAQVSKEKGQGPARLRSPTSPGGRRSKESRVYSHHGVVDVSSSPSFPMGYHMPFGAGGNAQATSPVDRPDSRAQRVDGADPFLKSILSNPAANHGRGGVDREQELAGFDLDGLNETVYSYTGGSPLSVRRDQMYEDLVRQQQQRASMRGDGGRGMMMPIGVYRGGAVGMEQGLPSTPPRRGVDGIQTRQHQPHLKEQQHLKRLHPVSPPQPQDSEHNRSADEPAVWPSQGQQQEQQEQQEPKVSRTSSAEGKGTLSEESEEEEEDEEEEEHPMFAEVRMIQSCAAKIQASVDEHGQHVEDGRGDQSPMRLLFNQFCAVAGHSDLQKGSRLSTMDLREWLECLVHLEALQFSVHKTGAEFKVQSHHITKKDASEIFETSKKRGSKASHDLAFDEFFTAIRRVEALLTKVASRKKLQATKMVERKRARAEEAAGKTQSMPVHKFEVGGVPEIKQLRAILNTHRTRVGIGFGHNLVAKARTGNIQFNNPFRDPSLDQGMQVSKFQF